MVNDANDTQQIDLIRTHLQMETGKFQQGDFSDPTRIHGDMMPGVTVLTAGANRITFTYETLPNGTAIRYQTSDPALIAAIHEWFAAQRSDHGAHQMNP